MPGTEEWNFYLCQVNDRLASIYVNLGLRSEAPVLSKPWLFWVWVYFKSPGQDGLSDSAEAPSLYEIEDALSSQLSQSCRTILCGRITTEGRREFYFYGESREGFEKAVANALSAFEGYRFDLGHQQDALWEQYLDVLYPSEEQMQCIKNGDVLAVLEKSGDIHSVAREVRHWIFFPSERARGLFQEAATQAGFKMSFEGPAEGNLPFQLQVTRTESVERNSIDTTVLELFRMARQFNGDYDGWETQVVTQ